LFLWFCTHAAFLSVAGAASLSFAIWWSLFWLAHRGTPHFYFDPQDDFAASRASGDMDRVFPKVAETATFEPMLKHYIGVTQLLVTIAAASIAFGGSTADHTPRPAIVSIAKVLLAWSVFYGVLFCALLLWRYDEYGQNMKSYTLPWHATVFACAFSSLTLFIIGFVVWGFGLL
jgi:hypothetical protein